MKAPSRRASERSPRDRIVAMLGVLPGAHTRAIARTLALPLGTVRYHLRTLQRAGRIQTVPERQKARHYLIDSPVSRSGKFVYGNFWRFRDVRTRVRLATDRLGVAGAGQIGAEAGVSRQLATYHLDCMVRSGELQRVDRAYVAATVEATRESLRPRSESLWVAEPNRPAEPFLEAHSS